MPNWNDVRWNSGVARQAEWSLRDRARLLDETIDLRMQLADRAPDPLWARRSHFAFAGQSVLVSEIFSPQLLQLPGSGKENSTEGQRVL